MKKDSAKKRISASDLAVLSDTDPKTIQRVFGAIAGALIEGKEVNVQNFGTFEAREMKGRGDFVSPLTGKAAFGASWVKPSFKAAKQLKDLCSGDSK